MEFWKAPPKNKYKFLISNVPFVIDQKGRWKKTFKNYYLYAGNKIVLYLCEIYDELGLSENPEKHYSWIGNKKVLRLNPTSKGV